MITNGSQVTIHYTLTVDDEIIDSSVGGDPLTYTQGGHDIIVGLERQLEGLAVGDRRDITVAPEEGYGVYDPRALQVAPRDLFSDPDGIAIGDRVEGQVDGRHFRAFIAEMDGDAVTLDLNHPLAGKTLRFAVEVIAIE